MVACQPIRWAAARGRQQPAEPGDHRVASIGAQDEPAGERAARGFHDAALGVDAGDGRFGKKESTRFFGFAAQPVVEHVAADRAGPAPGCAEIVAINRALLRTNREPADFLVRQRGERIGETEAVQIFQMEGLRQLPQTLGRGKGARSSNATRRPARARTSAASEPAGPAPTMTASWEEGIAKR